MGNELTMPLVIPLDGEGVYSDPIAGVRCGSAWYGQFGDWSSKREWYIAGDRGDFVMTQDYDYYGDGRSTLINHWQINERTYWND